MSTPRPALVITVVFVAGSLVLATIGVLLGYDQSWDLKNYHFYSPYALLNGRFDFDMAAAQVQTYLNPLPFVPFHLSTRVFTPIQTGLLLGALHGSSLGLLFWIGCSVFASARPPIRYFLALTAAIMGCAGPLFVRQLGTTYNDILIAPLVLIALLLYVERLAVGGEASWRRLGAAGLLLGIAAGLKLVFVVWALAFVPAMLVAERGWRHRAKCAGVAAIGSTLGLLISRGYWMGLLWKEFGSPLFPFYNTIFRSPLYYDHDFTDPRYLPTSTAEALQKPFELSDHRFGVLIGAIVLAVFISVVRWSWRRFHAIESVDGRGAPDVGEGRVALFLSLFTFLGLVIWEAKFSIARYALPIELIAPMAVLSLLWISGLWPRPWMAMGLALALMLVVVLTPVKVRRIAWFDDWFYIEAPSFENPEEVLVILADDEPMSYVIPYFQPEVRFVCPWNNFTKPSIDDTQPRIGLEMVEFVKNHEGPIYAIAPNQLKFIRRYELAPRIAPNGRPVEPRALTPRTPGEIRRPSSGLYLHELRHTAKKDQGSKRGRR